MGTFVASTPAAIEQALALFEPAQRPASLRLRDGYLDLLGEQDGKGPRFAQRALHSKTIPPVYERFSRPLMLRLLAGRKAPKGPEEHRIALRMLDLSSGDRVLDMACGPGNFTRDFATATGDGLVVGLDVSKAMLAAAVRRTPNGNVAYVRGDACAMPFQDACFDAVCCFGALHLFQQPMKALDEIVRVVVPGGRVGILTTSDDSDRAHSDGSQKHKLGGIRIFARGEIVGALAERGLTDIEQRAVGLVDYISARKPAS